MDITRNLLVIRTALFYFERVTRTVLMVDGVTCANCVRSITRALEEVPGVSHAELSLSTFTAAVEHAPEATPIQLIAAIEAEGYSATAV